MAGLRGPGLRAGCDHSSISASGKRSRWPTFRYGIAPRSTSFRACRSVMFSQAHSSSRVSMRVPVPYAAPAPIATTPPSRRLPGCRTFGCRAEARSSPRFVQCGFPALAVGDDVQQAPGMFHVVRVAGRDGFPGVVGRVGCRNTEGGHEPVLAVGAVVGQRLTGPLAGDQDPAARVAEGRSSAGHRSGASWRTAASTARIAERRPAGRRARSGRRSVPGGSRRLAW